MGNYKLYKIDCLLGQKRAACVGLPGLARGKGIIVKNLREDRLVDVINVHGEVEYGWAPSAVEVFLGEEEYLMSDQHEHLSQCQECAEYKAIIDNLTVIDGDVLEEIESRDPEPYLPFVNRLKELMADN